MQQDLYPLDWKARAAACLARAGYCCEHCSIPHGVLRVGKRSKSPYVVYVHAAHINHDPENPQAELQALCPACHMKHDRRTERKETFPRRQGYQVVSTSRLLLEMHGAGLRIARRVIIFPGRLVISQVWPMTCWMPLAARYTIFVYRMWNGSRSDNEQHRRRT
jgi:hypothetical protein